MANAPVVAAVASFGLGLLASLTPCASGAVSRTIAIFGATAETSRWRRAALSGTFVLGVAVFFTPLGLFAALSGALIGWALWSTVAVGVVALLCTVLAASMFGAFAWALPADLRRKVAAVGGNGFRGAFAMGLVVGVLAAPTTLPLVIGLSTVVVDSGNGWLGGAAFFSFALGLGAPFFVAGTSALRPPERGPWTAAGTWIGGVGLGYLALAHLHDHLWPLRALVRNPRYEPGIVAGAVLLLGTAFGAVHVLAERRGSAFAHLSRPMRLASIVPAVVGFTLFVSWLPHPHGNAPPIPWITDEVRGRAIALAEDRPVILVFNAEWCCRWVEHDMFFHPRVREEAMRFTAIAVDATDDEMAETRRLTAKYKVLGVPTIIMLDGAGQEVCRIDSFVDPLQLVAEMETVPSAGAGR